MIKLHSLIKEDIWLKPYQIPDGIKNWIRKMSGKNLQKYKMDQTGELTISTPWHESSRETYQKFKLTPDGNAIDTGEEMTRSGMEPDSPQGYQDSIRKSGTMQIPSGIIVVKYSTYPEMVTIYTAKDAQGFLPQSESDFDLNMSDVFILAAAKQLKPAYRPKFKDDSYNILIEKGLLNKNRSITVDGINILQNPKAQELLKKAIENYEKNTGRYSPVSTRIY